MHLLQIYETRLVHIESRKSVWALIVPTKSLQEVSAQNFWQATISKLKLKEITRVRPANLAAIIASMLIPEDQDTTNYRLSECIKAARGHSTNLLETSEFEFAEQIAFRNILPFEHSPLTKESLASLVAASSEVNHCGSANLVKTQHKTEIPLLLVSHQEGMIICGAGPAVQNALSQGLWDSLLDWLQAKPKRKKKKKSNP